jgi:hypothetical protein
MSGNHVSVVIPQPNPRKTRRFGGVAGVAAEANRRNPSDSKAGKAMSEVLD